MIVSSNWAAYVISGVLFIFNFAWRFFSESSLSYRERLQEVRKAIKKDGLRSVVLLAIFWAILFTASFTNVLNEDRAALEKARKESGQLQTENKDVQRQLQENCRNDKRRAEDGKMEAARAKDDARHWQDAYERISHHEMHPDRHLDNTDIDNMNNQIKTISKNATKDALTFDFGWVQDREAGNLASQIYSTFKDAHWTMKYRGTVIPKQLEEAFRRNPIPLGIVIWSDDPMGKANLFYYIFAAGGLDVNVMPLSMLPSGFKGTVVWVGYKQFP